MLDAVKPEQHEHRAEAGDEQRRRADDAARVCADAPSSSVARSSPVTIDR